MTNEEALLGIPLSQASEKALAMIDNDPDIDPEYKEKMKAQIWVITHGDHVYFVWLNVLTDEERAKYGSVENHPQAYRICWMYWIETGAFIRWGEEWEAEQKKKREARAASKERLQ